MLTMGAENMTLLQENSTYEHAGNETTVDNRYDIIQNKAVQALFCIIYTTIFVLGIFGNVLVCYVVGRNKAMQTVTNFFITNLALSDILLCALAVPFTPLYSFLEQWIFGSVLCHLVPLAQGTSVYISTLTLTSIAVDRFFVIIYPFHPRMKLTTCLSIIVSIWVFSLLVTLPYGIFMSHKSNGPYYVCEEAWTDNYRKLFGAFTSIAQFVLPFFVITFCYVRVSLRLNERGRANPGARSSRREEADRERKRRTNRMLIAMVTIFGVSWLPLNTVNLLNDVYKDIGDWPYYNLCFFMVHAIAMSSTCYNPFLYAWLNENFRKEFKQVLPCFENPRHSSGLGPATASIALTSGPRRSLGGSLGSTKGSRHGAAAACNGSNESGETRLSAAPTTTTTATYTKETEHVELRISDGEALIGDKEITVGNGEPVLEELRPTPEDTTLLELSVPNAAPPPPPTVAELI